MSKAGLICIKTWFLKGYSFSAEAEVAALVSFGIDSLKGNKACTLLKRKVFLLHVFQKTAIDGGCRGKKKSTRTQLHENTGSYRRAFKSLGRYLKVYCSKIMGGKLARKTDEWK